MPTFRDERLDQELQLGGLPSAGGHVTAATADGQHLHIHLAKHAPYADVRAIAQGVRISVYCRGRADRAAAQAWRQLSRARSI